MNDATTSSAPYRVLARKYRPSTFDDLIGQDAMVRTISNAFESGRIPQAWVLTGVRGVGKTTTARILARALNYELADGSVTGPTVKMPVLGVHCQAIMESRHLDVIEMDAASHNGVEDVRAINDAVRYAPVSARYKVYILDEVHMLSGAAFNALLKTLEEPPPHAKFVFATTEIRKVPITVLSRCQRFDLRRVDAALLVKHLQGIAAKESIAADTEALALIARAAEGSVRDALSLFDQGIAHAGASGAGTSTSSPGPVRAEDVRGMLGLADRTRVIDLFEALMRADIARALAELRDQYDTGADPAMVLGDLAEFTRRCVSDRGRAHARPRLCGQAVDAGAGAHLADAAERHRRSRGGRTAAGGRRDGSGPHRLRRRSADARRGHPPLARRGRARQWCARRGARDAFGAAGTRAAFVAAGAARCAACGACVGAGASPAQRAAQRRGRRDGPRRRQL
jgi:DNA polymerase III subunit gamma/tau